MVSRLVVLLNALVIANSRSPSEYLSANLYFAGVSKCGTTSIAETLLAHPLISAVGGNQKGVLMAGRESRLFGHFPEERVIVEQDKRIRFHLLNKTQSREIKKRGIIFHYTPNYSILPDLAQMILNSLKTLEVPNNSVRYLFALRDPVTRTQSSWWYKEHCYLSKTANACPSFSSQVEKGITAAHLLERCYESHNQSLHSLVTHIASSSASSASLAAVSTATSVTLRNCSNDLLIPQGANNLKVCHVGKSLYVHQLLHWYRLIPPSQIYLLYLESYQRDPVSEIESLLRWLNLPRYGVSGYRNRETLRNLTNKRYNAYPIPREVREREITGEETRRLKEFYRPSVMELRRLLLSLEGRTVTERDSESPEEGKGEGETSEDYWLKFIEEMKRVREEKMEREGR
jgi:hypothetical protein